MIDIYFVALVIQKLTFTTPSFFSPKLIETKKCKTTFRHCSCFVRNVQITSQLTPNVHYFTSKLQRKKCHIDFSRVATLCCCQAADSLSAQDCLLSRLRLEPRPPHMNFLRLIISPLVHDYHVVYDY